MDARLQLFDLKTKYQFMTSPGVDQYNMPLYDVQTQPGSQNIASFPVYQGFVGPAYVNGVQIPLFTQKQQFFGIWPNIVQNLSAVAVGDGGATYSFTIPIIGNTTAGIPQNPPLQYLLRGHVDISGVIATTNNEDPIFDTTINPLISSTSIIPAVYITSIDANGNNIIACDSGQFLQISSQNMPNYGLLMTPGNAPSGNAALPGGYFQQFAITGVTQANPAVLTATTTFQIGQSITIGGVNGMTELNGNTYVVTNVTGTTVTINVDSTGFGAYTSGGTATSLNNVINYFTGEVLITFPTAVPDGNNINVSCYFFQTGLPRSVLFYNNILTFRSPPADQYIVELDAYLTPAAFLNSSAALPYAYMSEYIARGAARKILSDTGDVEQFMFYEPLFKEQELLVWKRSQRQWTATRTETIYSQGGSQGQYGSNYFGGVSS